jgi:hypothetical protein
MKILSGLAIAAFMIGSASATTYYGVVNCGSFSNPAPNSPLSGTWVCPTAATLGISNVSSETLVYNSDYSNGEASNVTTSTTWTFAGATLQFGADTTTSTGGSNSNPAVSTDGLTIQPLTNLPPVVLAGFYDTASAFGTITVNWTNSATVGSAVQATGYAQVIYDYSVTSSSPEPVSMLLLGSGLLGLSFIGRKKFAKK